MVVALFSLAHAQVVPNPSLDGPLPSEIPNALVADGWTFYEDPDLGLAGIDFHCAPALLDPSVDGGTFVRAVATNHPQLGELRQGIAAPVTGLVVGVPYLVRFEAALVRHLGRSSGYWEVRFGGLVGYAPTIPVPAGDPDMAAWRVQTVGPFVATTDEVDLQFRATTLYDGVDASPYLPAGECNYDSDAVLADLLIDGIQVVGDHDLDSLYDDAEAALGTDPWLADTDADGIDDATEVGSGLDPVNPDSDYDGALDGAEQEIGTDPHLPDTDGDGLLDGDEVVRGTDPLSQDTDRDGLGDHEEASAGTDPTLPDTDADGLLDPEELGHGTDPTDADTDDDGFSDAYEVAAGTDPLDAEDPAPPADDSGTAPTDTGSPDPREPAEEDFKDAVGCDCDAGAGGFAGLPLLALVGLVVRRRR